MADKKENLIEEEVKETKKATRKKKSDEDSAKSTAKKPRKGKEGAEAELTEEEKTDYTLILKGHIALAMAKFPVGTRGAQLDVLARMPIWKYGMNFLHGTGHGVGHFLSVHEGPQSIRMNENPVVLQPGMVTSNEP